MYNMINYTEPTITPEDVAKLSLKLSTLPVFIAGNGNSSEKVKRKLSEISGYEYVVLVNSATTGLYLAMEYLKLMGTSRVRVPATTFVATANAAYLNDISVDIIDIESNIPYKYVSPVDVPVSYSGYPQSGGLLIDDAHFIHPDMNKVKGDEIFRVLSFHGAKVVTSGEGGAILTDDYDAYRFLASYVDHGRIDTLRPYAAGLNFRMADMNAILLESQLNRLPQIIDQRVNLVDFYNTNLIHPSITLPHKNDIHSYHLYPILLPTNEIRNSLQERLFDANIGTQIHYPPLTKYQHLATSMRNTPNAVSYWERTLSIPLHLNLSRIDLQYIVSNILYILDTLK